MFYSSALVRVLAFVFSFCFFTAAAASPEWDLHFRAEFFNLINHPNFGIPSPVALTVSGSPAASAGLITSTATTSRQIQFGLKLSW